MIMGCAIGLVMCGIVLLIAVLEMKDDDETNTKKAN